MARTSRDVAQDQEPIRRTRDRNPGAESGTVFTRIAIDDDERARALQMSIVTYEPGDGKDILSVDLVSAIHIGDPPYYAELNERFREYDVLLYELVAKVENYIRYYFHQYFIGADSRWCDC